MKSNTRTKVILHCTMADLQQKPLRMTCTVLLDLTMDLKLQNSSRDFQFYLQKPFFTPDNDKHKKETKAS